MDEKRRPTVIIVGSGRSGTSAVAKICHEELGICMGHFLKTGDEMNPDGYYEDLVSHALTVTAIQVNPGTFNPTAYLKIMNTLHTECLAWGVKDPWFLYHHHEYLSQIRPKLCVVAHRDVEATVKSWEKIWKKNNREWKKENPGQTVPTDATEYYRKLTITRQEAIERLPKVWPNMVTVDFTNRVSDDYVITTIRNGLANAVNFEE